MNRVNMIVLRLILQRYNQPDDTVVIRRESEHSFKLTYTDGSYRPGNFSIHLPPGGVVHYVHDLLKSLSYDSDPYEFLQVMSTTAPSVLYHTSDLASGTVRDLIVRLTESAVNVRVDFNRYFVSSH